ncbi:MAG: flagellar export protein FliJ [Defluviitaleaceae bacterium]|nr:flagellar export protein FliJ [Defluviitaleaceae bacterium]
MPKFQFRLQKFLGVKEQIEDQKELEYGKALQKLEAEKIRLRELNEQRILTVESLREAVRAAISPLEVKRYNENIERLKQQIKAQEERVAAAEAFAEEKRQELIQAMKERKALEIVKENALEEFLHEVDLAERKQVDELVSFKYTDKLQETHKE